MLSSSGVRNGLSNGARHCKKPWVIASNRRLSENISYLKLAVFHKGGYA